jgi:ATP-dependent protease ClpP protease subunit
MTEAIEQEAADFATDVEFATTLATVEKLQAEAELVKWQAQNEKLSYEQEKFNFEHQLNGEYTFNRDVTQKSAARLLRACHVWHQHDPEAPWTIYLNSVGGELYNGNAIIDELTSHSLRGGGTHHITIKVRGVAASMGGMILQAADHRVIGLNSQIMIHKGGAGMNGHVTLDQLADEVEFFRQSTDWMIRLFLSRTDKITRPEFLEAITRRDWWLFSEEAVKVGFADAIG